MCIPYSIQRFLRATAKPAGSRDGFTLLELMMAVLVAVGVMAIAVPSLQTIVRHHAPEELVSELHLARMSAIRQHRPVTVTFLANSTQCTVSWFDDAGANITKPIDLGRQGEVFLFDFAPPGAATPAPDNAFIFSPLGFISTIPGGNVSGNIYLSNRGTVANRSSLRQYQIQTTIAGGIDLNRYNAVTDAWDRAN